MINKKLLTLTLSLNLAGIALAAVPNVPVRCRVYNNDDQLRTPKLLSEHTQNAGSGLNVPGFVMEGEFEQDNRMYQYKVSISAPASLPDELQTFFSLTTQDKVIRQSVRLEHLREIPRNIKLSLATGTDWLTKLLVDCVRVTRK